MRVVNGVKGKNGLEAWRRLTTQYEKRREDKAMQAQVELVKMAGRRARDPKELKGLLRELDERKKAAEEVGKVDEGQMKTTLVMMLDG